jgi:hypothetical protein
MLCFVPDGKRVIKNKDIILICNLNNIDLIRAQKIKNLIYKIHAGDEICLVNASTNTVYWSVVSLLLEKNEGEKYNYKIYTKKLRKIGNLKNKSLDSLIFETRIENIVDNYTRQTKPKNNYYRKKNSDNYKGYGMRGLRKANQKEAYEREQAWLERLNNKKLWTNLD